MVVNGRDRLVGLDRECYPKNPLSDGQLQFALNAEGWLVVLESEGKGYLVAECTEAGIVLRRLGVSVGSRREGIGSKLLRSFRNHRVDCKLGEGNVGGAAFLRANGFRCVGLERGQGKGDTWQFRRAADECEGGETGENT